MSEKELKNIDEEIKYLKHCLDTFENLQKEFLIKAELIIDDCKEGKTTKFLKHCDDIERLNGRFNPALSSVESFYKTTYKAKRNLDNLLSFACKFSGYIDSLNLYSKYFKESIQKAIILLNEEKDILKKQNSSTNLKEKDILKKEFLEKEKQIFEIYKNNSKFDLLNYDLKHFFNSIKYDAIKMWHFICNKKLLSISSILFLGSILCVPYFIIENKVPSISFDELYFALIVVFAFGFLTLFYIGVIFLYQNYLLFDISKYNKTAINHAYIYIYHLLFLTSLLLIVCNSLKDNLLILLFSLMAVLSLFFAIYSSFKSKTISNTILFLLLIFISDFLFFAIVKFRSDEIDVLALIMFVIIWFFARLLSMLKIFEYSLQGFFAILILFVILLFLHKDFVRLAGIANYDANYIVPTKFIPKHILDSNLSKCDKDNETCIIKFDENLTMLKNVKVVVKSDEKYFLKLNKQPFECEKFNDKIKCNDDIFNAHDLKCKNIKENGLECEYSYPIFEINQKNIVN
ncbi:hypothetical protein LMG7974_01216 [Campylobacter majalis]|uniref:Pentapeptide repeat-containing protein n=1 Tax=Campylobacter majalis TaxID=2790656 RepID=A0ABN7K903_9BACT|nr:hypothetical protein [Campylobacter majalis]CAD7288905.1 hypothetical protein LMG7974_01216 [Campylobacter majalis]